MPRYVASPNAQPALIAWFANRPLPLADQWYLPHGDDLLQQADLESITRTVVDLANEATPLSGHDGAAVEIEDTVYDTPQTGGWSRDAVGYNFLHVIPASAFPAAGHHYRVTLTGTLSVAAAPPGGATVTRVLIVTAQGCD